MSTPLHTILPSPPISFGPVLFGSDPDSAPASKGINSKPSGRVSSSVGKRRMFFKRVLGSGYNSWRPGVGGLCSKSLRRLEERRDTPNFNPNDTKSTRKFTEKLCHFNQDTSRLSSFNSRVSQSISRQTLLDLMPKHQAEKKGTKFSSIRSHKVRSKSYGRPQRPCHITSFSPVFFSDLCYWSKHDKFINLASCSLFHCKSQMHIWGPRTFPSTFHHHGILGGPDTA